MSKDAIKESRISVIQFWTVILTVKHQTSEAIGTSHDSLILTFSLMSELIIVL